MDFILLVVVAVVFFVVIVAFLPTNLLILFPGNARTTVDRELLYIGRYL